MLDDFILRALLGGMGAAAIAGPLGCMVVWRRMAFFGETIAHSALLGVALGLLLGVNVLLGVAAITITVSLLLVAVQNRQLVATDTLLGILAHAMLSFGLIATAFITNARLDLMGYLFGDILAVTGADLMWIFGGGALVLAALAAIWRPLLAATIHEELAAAEGVQVMRVRIALMLLIAVTMAVAMKIVGILLITSLLIIPAATARPLARTPESMALLAALAGMLAVALGLGGAFVLDLPAGPAIVAAASALFAAGFALTHLRGTFSRKPPS